MKKPLTDSLLGTAPPGAKPVVGVLSWGSGFGVGTGTRRIIVPALRVIQYKPPIEHGGKKWAWCVEEVEFAEDRKTLLRIVKRWGARSEAEAEAAFKEELKIRRARDAKRRAEQAAADARKPSLDEKDLAEARLKVLREQYPGTCKAMDALAQAPPEGRAHAVEAALRAYAVDMARLHKPAHLGEITPFDTLPADGGLLQEIAKAYRAKSPHDPVDAEIAANWLAAGYNRMSLAEYTRAINHKTGANLKPEAMEKRRYKKLGLMTKKAPGPRPKF